VARRNPMLAGRSTLGDVAASIVAHWPQSTELQSVMEVSRRIGATRLATTPALQVLELAGRAEIDRPRRGRSALVRVLAAG